MDQLSKIIENFPGKRVGIVGDLMLDRYLSCEIKRISQEAPIPIAKVLNEKFVLGGAANVAANVRSLGGEAEVLGLFGTDSKGEMMLKMLREQGIERSLSLKSSDRPTTVKTRIVSGNHQIVRIDMESDENISKNEEEEILSRLPEFLDRSEIIIISDYAKGFVTENLAKKIILLAKERGIKVLVDPKKFEYFTGAYLIKPNKEEAEHTAGVRFMADYSNASEILKILHEKFNSNLAVTLGKDGMMISEGKGISRTKSLAKEVYDVSGAGDTVMAALALGLASGSDLKTSALISNYAAGVAVSKVGTATVSVLEVLELIKKNGVSSFV
ncbi:hypothetical protein A3I27_00130 [Candidatus Giovannonibacteria bacterium RIFCSPLOWO2_02_FULL_43_11b]|uniref:Carbohydrate kinase PfkB domain-containing protein n=1 Tax=Candidatus Giovannonibacteria bacterium RIFCSPHIGHO2_12_FULL_43_15 TaxID=1798341 RepID=A0A1F5WQJ7_9BACT|nr:MAG: hypothetical protein A2739_02280 [Candidatus Giovannonibacteria bacterium RIFCSPHIGHO2_01_FULL_43_100]OGF67013.1 MAG: hypothetical protein A3B97_00235 [Candidatus Giovannonibacteria bacterium RIFCSPHIGHO2_02_FULL_43_32]OGF77935.1 MAG: hypothetical protein A3F23_04360 [Candidatus Giovannonibacteria bacterium RIFCSPHIGHO2_12_FULL_43_15]OGF78710.1 MAG: hypothetical protein A3A15_02035 [Candidatus Giovannonibacteria bacterium RIFCSPLOWO2_01_FULL_43_60]OGF89391.1 MAG: hypothetical protein A3